MTISKIKMTTIIYVVVCLLVAVFLFNAVRNYHQSKQSISSVNSQLTAQQHSLKAASQQQQDYEKVTSQDIRNTSDLAELSNHFINDVFDRLQKQTISDKASQYATQNAVSAFLGSTFGGDVDEGKPSIKLIKTDIDYSKDASGAGIGFGTITYQLNQRTQTLTVLMQMQAGKINEIQTGQVKDTSGSGTND